MICQRKKTVQPKISNEEIRRLVIERLRSISSDKAISIGSNKSYSKDELIEEIAKGSHIGNKMIQIELEFLRSLKNISSYDPEITSHH